MISQEYTHRLEAYISEKFTGRAFSSLDDFSPFIQEKHMRALSSALVELKKKGVIVKVGSIPILRGGSPRALYKYVGKPHEVVRTTYVSDSELYAQQNNAQLMLHSVLNKITLRSKSY